MNPDRCVIGLATVFGEPCLNVGQVWHGWQFRDFVAAEMGVEMRDEHRAPIDDAERLGTWHGFAVLEAGTTPAGLLTIGQLGHSPAAEGRLRMLEWHNPWARSPQWGLSITAADASAAADGSRMWVKEVSFTGRPAHPMARVIGVGPYALDVWTLLTGRPAPTVVATTAGTMHRRLRGIGQGGRIVWDEWTG